MLERYDDDATRDPGRDRRAAARASRRRFAHCRSLFALEADDQRRKKAMFRAVRAAHLFAGRRARAFVERRCRRATTAATHPDQYETLAAPAKAIVTVKLSRFVALASHAATPEAARSFIAQHRDDGARHNCWCVGVRCCYYEPLINVTNRAYTCGQELRSADDGEPSGTAGAPILRALSGARVNYAVVLVVRYFGGILLGTGGLTRAYGGAASAALQAAPRRLVVATVNAAVSFAFSDSGAVYAVLDSCGAERMKESYSADGAMLSVRVYASAASALDAALADATSGRVRLDIQPSQPIFPA